MNGYNFSLIVEKNNGLEYDLEFEKSKLDTFCKYQKIINFMVFF